MRAHIESSALRSSALGLPPTPPPLQAPNADVVIEWNRLLQTATGALPPSVFFTRPYALMHVAVFDALNSIDYLYTPYAAKSDAVPGTSREAAAAQAAHDVLAALLPTQRPVFEAALASTMGRLPTNAGREGSRVGAAAAHAVLELRSADGPDRVPRTRPRPDLAGFWQPTPPQTTAAPLTHYPDVVPLAIRNWRTGLDAAIQWLPPSGG